MKKRSRNKARTANFELKINGKTLEVSATPYLVNGEETRFRVSYNESPVFIFGLDPVKKHVSVIDSHEAMPESIESAISSQLEQFNRRIAA